MVQRRNLHRKSVLNFTKSQSTILYMVQRRNLHRKESCLLLPSLSKTILFKGNVQRVVTGFEFYIISQASLQGCPAGIFFLNFREPPSCLLHNIVQHFTIQKRWRFLFWVASSANLFFALCQFSKLCFFGSWRQKVHFYQIVKGKIRTVDKFCHHFSSMPIAEIIHLAASGKTLEYQYG